MASAPNERVGERPKSPGVGWKYFREPRFKLEIFRATAASIGKFGRRLGVYRLRCSRPEGDRGIPNVWCRYLVGDNVIWD